MTVKGAPLYLKFLFCLIVCFVLGQSYSAQADEVEEDNTALIGVKRIALVDLDGVIRNADANNRDRKSVV